MSGWRLAEDVALPPSLAPGRLLWCGIGGSLLPADALIQALAATSLRHRWQPLASPETNGLRLEAEDQLVFASKSGRTLELWTWIGRLRAQAGWGRWHQVPVVITQDDQNPLARLARAEGWTLLPIPEKVGGRYSAFTAIGALPLHWAGLEAPRFLSAAREVVAQTEQERGPWGVRVWDMVATLTTGYLRGTDQWVLMPYATHLETVGAWWVQLVAESLGKQAADGSRRGFTPIRAIGPQDQHAQLQRWLDGPRNVGMVMVTVGHNHAAEPSDPPSQCPFPGLGRWGGEDIVRAQAEGTREALEEAGIPVVHWHLDSLDEASLGAFLMAWQLAVGLCGVALEVDPFDQPAVESGKRRTLLKLGIS
ncbi:hypothetical protein [Geothrix campi]|jgi:glucose-6-phosphate isomerase|uniref:hypothetical protein n=1 Tax=Geothrix campi TaxID=2966450 RepID=UPI0021472CCC|nr:hypothetical protein [Geothrix sp. SG10]